jgi:hypothetical protein
MITPIQTGFRKWCKHSISFLARNKTAIQEYIRDLTDLQRNLKILVDHKLLGLEKILSETNGIEQVILPFINCLCWS